MNDLRNKTKKGLIWSAAERFIAQGIQLAITLILARLLGPTAFGMIGMLAIFIAIANIFVDSGFSSALIRKTDRNENDLTTAFYYNILVSILCYIVLYFSSPYISTFYQQPELTSLLRVLSLSVIINPFILLPRTLLSINLNFKTQAIISVISIVISGITSVSLAYYGYGVWSLVIQSLLNILLSAILYNILSPWRPKGKISRISFDYLFNFGNKLLLSGLLDTTYNNLYQIIIGKKFNLSSVGEFTQANQLTSVPAMTLTNIIQRVTYPMFSQMQHDTVKMDSTYRLTIKLSALIIFPIIVGLGLIAKPLIYIILGEKWIFSSTLLSLLCFGYMLYPVHAINLNLLQVKGRSDLFLRLEIIKKATGIIILLITIPYGIFFMCVGFSITSYLSLFFNTYYTSKLSNITQWQQCKDLLPIWIAVMISATLGYLIGDIYRDTPYLQIAVNLIVAASCYFFYLLLAQKNLLLKLKSLLLH